MPLTPEQWMFLGDANGNTNADALAPDIAQLSNGNILLSWVSADDNAPTQAAGTDIRGQIYTPKGMEVGGEFRLNVSRTAGDEGEAKITALAAGGFAVSYIGDEVPPGGGSSIDTEIVVDVFANDGTFLVGEVMDDTGAATASRAHGTDIASTSAASILTLWYDDTSANLVSGLYDPVTDSAGARNTVFDGATGPSAAISSFTVTALDNGTYGVVYAQTNTGNDALRFQLVDGTTGLNLGPVTTIDFATQLDDVSVATLTNGKVIVAYAADSTGSGDADLGARILNADGSFFSPVLHPATTTAGHQGETAVAALDNGEAVVFWFDADTHDIHGQRLSATGALLGSEFNVRAFLSTDMSHLNATRLADGRIHITWQENLATDDVVSAIWDARDAVNTPDINGFQIGTIGADTFEVAPGAGHVFGYNGDDRVTVDADEVDPAGVFDGGVGTDILEIADGVAGHWDFTGEDVLNFEEIVFLQSAAQVVRMADFNADQLSGVTRLAFDDGAGSAEMLKIHMGDVLNLDLSALTVDGFDSTEDALRILGDSSNDTIIGTTQNDTLDGGAGADSLNGAGGDDLFIVANDGLTNVYHGGAGINTLDFGAYGAGISLTLNGGAASGSVTSDGTTTVFTGISNILGSAQGDTIRAAGGVSGGAGNDTLSGVGDVLVQGGGNDDALRIDDPDGTPDFDGGTGRDIFDASRLVPLHMFVDLGAGYVKGASTAQPFDGALIDIEDYIGQGGNDHVIGTAAANWLDTGGGNDTVVLGGGGDTVLAGAGDDLIHQSAGSDSVDGGADVDTLSYAAATGPVIVDLSNASNNSLAAAGDVIENIENIIGTTGADHISGDALSNTLTGNGGDDTLLGQGGDDHLKSTSGHEVLDGGAGADWADYGTAQDDLVLNLSANYIAGGTDAGNDTIIGIDNLILGAGDDRVFATSTENTLLGEMGDDTLAGLGGNDVIEGGAGQDALSGGSGNDTLWGGTQDDRIFGNNEHDHLYGEGGNDTLNGGTGDDTVDGGADDDDAVVGGTGNDLVRGGAGDDGLNGSAGDDTVEGDIGADRVFGGDGLDILSGGAEGDVLGGGADADMLFGDSGDDGLNGNSGNDTMDGGAGADTLFGSTGDDILNGGSNDGASDLLMGQGGIDTFVFEGNWGADSIARYGEQVQGGARTYDEVIDMSGTTADEFLDLQFAQVGNNVVINVYGDTVNTITILFETLADITADDFVFV